MKYTYEVTSITKDGIATVEYKHEELGSVIKTIFVPYDTASETTVRRLIAEQFPIQAFYSRYLMKAPVKPDVALIEGELDISFSDRFYNVQVEIGKTVDV